MRQLKLQRVCGDQPRLTSLLAIGLAVALLSSCVSPQVQPDSEAISKIRSIEFVPMEAPPLSIGSTFVATGSSSIVHFLPRYTLGMARTVGLLSGIVVMLELAESSHRRPEYPEPVQREISSTETWFPTVELAREASQLSAASGKTVTRSSAIQPIPGILNRDRTVLMENWMAPIRSWYNDASPSNRYTNLAAKGVELVAEVGISNYEIYAGKLLLQVHVKLIDTASGQLVGRARASSFTALPSMDEAFAADGKRFKESVSLAGNQLMLTCLQELRVVPR